MKRADGVKKFVTDYIDRDDLVGFAIVAQHRGGCSMWEQSTDDPKRMAEVLASVVEDVIRLRLANLKKEAAALGFDLVPFEGHDD